MFFESQIFNVVDHWASPKIFIFFNFLIKILLNRVDGRFKFY
jgi:hypothetical protein